MVVGEQDTVMSFIPCRRTRQWK